MSKYEEGFYKPNALALRTLNLERRKKGKSEFRAQDVFQIKYVTGENEDDTLVEVYSGPRKKVWVCDDVYFDYHFERIDA